MPRKSKKAAFRGIPSWKMKEEIADERMLDVTDASTSASALCQSETRFTPASDLPTTSKCEARLQGSFLDNEIPSFSPSDISKGYRLIDLECLSEALLHVRKCPTGGLTVIDEQNVEKSHQC